MKKGFTFIELLIVVAIIGLITGLSTPLFSRTFSALQLDNLSRNIAGLARFCQERAIIERSMYRLKLDQHGGRYWVLRQEEPEDGERFTRIKGRIGRVHYVPRGSSIESGVDHITFYPDGRADQAAVYLRDRSGSIYTLSTARRIGHVKVVKGKEQ